jgi:diguanylate cyclase (GGDEF)-like protein
LPGPHSSRCSLPRWTLLFSLLGFPFFLAAQNPPKPLTTIAAVRNLPYADAAKALPVRVTGVITYNGLPDADVFIQDQKSWIYVLPDKPYNIPPGSLVEVIGKSSAGYTTQIQAISIRMIGPGHLPQPVLLDYAHALLHQNDCRYISFEGIIRAASFQSSGGFGINLLQLESEGKMVDVAVRDFPNFNPARLLDAHVRVAGALGGTFDATEERIVGLRLNVNSVSAITYLPPVRSASDLSTSTMSLAQLLASNESLRPWHRIVTTGTVTLYDPGELLVIQDGASGLLIHTRQVDNLSIGQRVSVTGFVTPVEGATAMELGQFTPLSGRGAVASRPISFADAMTGFYTNRLLTLDGTVVSQTRENHAHILFLRSGNQTLQVVFRKRTHDPDPLPDYAPGTSLRITGVCIVHFRGFWGEVESFQLRMRSASDIAVVHPASWWTLSHLFLLTSAVLVVALIALAWGLLLRRRLLAHETLLRQKSELEATRLSTAARMERQRSQILELINSFQPLPEVLSAIQAFAEELWPGSIGYTHVLSGRMLVLNVGPRLSPSELLRLQTIDPSVSPEICALAVRSRGITGHPETNDVWSRPILSSRGEILGTMSFRSRDGAPLPLQAHAFELGCNLAAIAIDNRRLYEDMLHRSRHDQLTGLPNRSVVEECLEESIRKAAENHSFAALLYLDLDNFKAVNDSFTHRVGDSYLIEVSHRFRACLRSGDIIGRIGGDEFVAVLTELDDPGLARVIADRLVHAMEAPFLIEHHLIRGSVSIGLAVYPASGQSAMSITHLADQAMYAAKRAGGNRICSSDRQTLYHA